MAVNCWLFCISKRTHCQNLWKYNPNTSKVSQWFEPNQWSQCFFQWFNLMDYNVKGTVNGCKKYQTIQLGCIDFNGSARSSQDHRKGRNQDQVCPWEAWPLSKCSLWLRKMSALQGEHPVDLQAQQCGVLYHLYCLWGEQQDGIPRTQPAGTQSAGTHSAGTQSTGPTRVPAQTTQGPHSLIHKKDRLKHAGALGHAPLEAPIQCTLKTLLLGPWGETW